MALSRALSSTVGQSVQGSTATGVSEGEWRTLSHARLDSPSTFCSELFEFVRLIACAVWILRMSYKNHVTHEEVYDKIQRAIGPHEDLTIVKRRKLKWYGHVSCSSGLAKTILQGTVKGGGGREGRRQGRQRKRWEDNIRERTGLEFTKPQRAVENRENGENWL